MKQKRAAMEMSVGTIVTIVLLMAMLVLGLFFVKNIMCSGIILTNSVDEKVTNEVKGLFGESDYGVKCMGENGQEIKLGDGGRRQIVCVMNVKEETEYDLKVVSVESLKGASTDIVKNWIIDQDWKGTISPGKKEKVVLLLNIPDKVSDTALKVEVEEENLLTGTSDTHILYLDVVHVGGVSAAIC